MNQTKSALLLVTLLILTVTAGIAVLVQSGYTPKGLHLVILALIVLSAIYAFITHFKRHRDHQKGIPVDDEMSTRIKYKAGHHAFLASLYMWLFIFLFKDFFPDVETMLGGGILLSAVISIVIKAYLTRHYNEDQD